MTISPTLVYDLADRRWIRHVFDPVQYDLGDRDLADHGLRSSFVINRQREAD